LLVRLGFRTLYFQRRCSTAWAPSPVHFVLVTLEMGLSWTVYLGWSWTVVLPISASQVARIIDVSHWSLA
jgi:hypothetical protein